MVMWLNINMKKWHIVFLLLLFIGAFVVRLYKFNNPIADWHSWRQADTSAVSRNFVQHGFDVLHPKFEDISNVPSGLDNPQGYRFVEFPIYNVLQAGGYVLFKTFTLEEWGRLVSIFASLASIFFVFLLLRKYSGKIAAYAAAFFLAFNPYTVYYSRTILPDPAMTATTLGAIYFYDKALAQKQKQLLWIVIATLFGITALLLKPYAIFFFLPIVAISYNKWKLKTLLQPYFWIFFVISALPLAWWRWWMLQYPAGIPASNWLFNAGNIRFTGAYFYWIFADRLVRLILGYWGIVLFALGLLVTKRKLFFFSFLFSSLAYVVIIARGNVQHDYYQILITPTIAIFVGLGIDFLLSLPKEIVSKWAVLATLAVSAVFSLMFGWYFVRDYFNINNPAIIAAGKITDQLTPKNAKVIALYNGDTSFLYQTNRQGWASLEKSIPDLITMGASYIVIANPTPNDFSGFGKEYKVVASSSQYLLLDIVHKP